MEKRPKRNINPKRWQPNKEKDSGSKDHGSEKEIIFGTRAVMEAIRAGKEIDKLLVQQNLGNELIKELLVLAQTHQIPVSKVPMEKLNRVTRKNHQGVLCFLSAIQYASLDHIVTRCFDNGKSPFVLLLDRVTDVRNFGAIARTAECSGVDAMVLPTSGSAMINSDAMKTSAGALNFIPVCREPNLKNTINYLKNSGIRVIACTEKAEKHIFDTDLTGPVALLLGSEENGVSPEYLKLCDAAAKIPMKGKIASLNVSVAAAVVLYETIRQQGQY